MSRVGTDLPAELRRTSITGSWAVDLEDGKLRWSPEMHLIYGTDPQTFIPTAARVAELLHPDDVEDLAVIADGWRSRPAPFAFVHRVIRPDGGVRTIEARGWVTRSPEGDTDWAVGTAHDVTDIVRDAEERDRLVLGQLELLRELVAAEERERHRIAGEIHDDTIQAFEAVSLTFADAIADRDGNESLKHLAEELDRATTRLRTMMFELMPVSAETGLAEALEAYCTHAFADSGVDWEVQCRAEAVGTGWNVLIFRLLHEAIRNVLRHAQASRVMVEVLSSEAGATLLVEDDGVGFSGLAEPTHAGLRLMAERVDAAGGSLSIGPRSDGTGTTVRIDLPPGIFQDG